MDREKLQLNNLLLPKDAIEEYKTKWLDIYLEDYGAETESEIRSRMNQTIYILESTPIETMDFVRKEPLSLKYIKYTELEEEYIDYVQIKKKIETILSKKFCDKTSLMYSKSRRVNSIKRLYLDYESYSIENQNNLLDKNTSNQLKDYILRRQQDYYETCKKMGIEAITSPQQIDIILSIQKEILKKEKEWLVKYTKWGHRIHKEVNKKAGFSIHNRELASVLYTPNSGVTSILFHRRKNAVICRVPLIERIPLESLDQLVFHENRHVVEMDGIYCGLDSVLDKKYSMINEIRTEKNAINDVQRLNNEPLFWNKPISNNYRNNYETLFDYTEDFFETYKDLLNKMAFYHDYERLEYYFGKENLIEFNRNLQKLEEKLIKSQSTSIKHEKEKIKTYIENMHDRYQSRQ